MTAFNHLFSNFDGEHTQLKQPNYLIITKNFILNVLLKGFRVLSLFWLGFLMNIIHHVFINSLQEIFSLPTEK